MICTACRTPKKSHAPNHPHTHFTQTYHKSVSTHQASQLHKHTFAFGGPSPMSSLWFSARCSCATHTWAHFVGWVLTLRHWQLTPSALQFLHQRSSPSVAQYVHPPLRHRYPKAPRSAGPTPLRCWLPHTVIVTSPCCPPLLLPLHLSERTAV